MSWEEENKYPNVDKEIVRLLCGGSFPCDPRGFTGWDRIGHFVIIPELRAFQGVYYGEPIGPMLRVGIIKDLR